MFDHRKLASFSVLVMVVASSPAPTQAVVTSWRFSSNGAFNDRTRWDVGVPTIGDTAVFDRGGTYTVSFPGHPSNSRPVNFGTDVLLVRDNVTFADAVTLLQQPNTYSVNRLTVGDVNGPSETLTTTLANFSAGTLTLGDVPGSTGFLNVAGGRLNVGGNLTIGNQSVGFLNVTGRGVLNQTGGIATLGLGSGPGIQSGGRATISGAGATWMANGLVIGDGGPGTLIIENSGNVTSSGASRVGVTNRPPVAGDPPERRVGLVTIGGNGATWTSGGTVTLGGNGDLNTGQGTLSINFGGTATIPTLSVGNNGTVNLNGGQLNVTNMTLSGGAAFNFNAGTLNFRGSKSLDDAMLDQILGPAHTIGPQHHLGIEGTATLNAPLIVDGGAFSAGQLVNSPLFGLRRGTLNVMDQAVVIEDGGLFSDTLDLAADVTINIARGITNRGLVTGDGRIGGPFHNAAAGALRAEPARSLTLTGAGNVNDGQIQLFGGLVDFTQDLTNNAGGFISGSGTLQVGTTLTNRGVMNFSGPAAIAGDVTNAATGRIIASGGGPTTFFDDVVNNGEIRTSPGSFSVFFGSLSGLGALTGTGTVLLEGDLRPGASPGAIDFGGDLTIGPAASLAIEIGGLLGGTEHDVVNVAGTATLGGQLRLDLIDGFEPGPTDTFTVLQANSVLGGFDNVSSGRRLQLSGGGGWFLVHYGPGSLFDPTQVVLSDFQVVGLSGDYNGNNLVEQGDLDVVLLHWGQPTPPVPAGWDYDLPTGAIDQEELDRVLLNWGKVFPAASLPPTAAGPAGVPEPLSLTLILLACPALASRWRPVHRLKRLLQYTLRLKAHITTRFRAGFARRVFLTAVTCWLVSSSMSRAANDVWDANGANPPSGVWSTGANWVDNTTPGNGDTATFTLPSAYTVTFNADPLAIQALTLENAANVTFTSNSFLEPSTLRVNSASGGQDVLLSNSATLSLGTSGGPLTPSRPLHLTVGDRLTLDNGGTLNVRFGSRLINSGVLVVGGDGQGTMNVTAGGVVTSAGGFVGSDEGISAVTVAGANSQWNNAGDLHVGFFALNFGQGTLTITGGGLVTTAL